MNMVSKRTCQDVIRDGLSNENRIQFLYKVFDSGFDNLVDIVLSDLVCNSFDQLPLMRKFMHTLSPSLIKEAFILGKRRDN